jgi:hypothetical protein
MSEAPSAFSSGWPNKSADAQTRSGVIPEHWRARTCGGCDHVRVIVRPQEPRDYEAAKVVYAEAFKRQDHGDRVPPEWESLPHFGRRRT